MGQFQSSVSLVINPGFQGDVVNQQVAKYNGAVAGDNVTVGNFVWVDSASGQLVNDPLQELGGFVVRNNATAYPAQDTFNGASLQVAKNTQCEYLVGGEIMVSYTNADATKGVTRGSAVYISKIAGSIGQVFFNVADKDVAGYTKLEFKVTRIYDNGLVAISNTYVRTSI